MTLLFLFVNTPRLVLGIRGNANDKLEMLALFWMMTFIVQIPLFGFIVFTDIFTPVRLAFSIAMDGVMMVFLVLEVIVGSLHLKDLIRDELKVIEMARKADEAIRAQPGPSYRPRVVNTSRGPEVNWVQDPSAVKSARNVANDGSDDDISDADDSARLDQDDQGVEYEMRIRPLTRDELLQGAEDDNNSDDNEDEDEEKPERDDSNQVSSTSDSVRQRPIRVL
jgi:hypothetical protein